MPFCAMTVPQADPAMPSPAPYTSRRLSTDVRDEPGDGDAQRGAGVLEAAQHTGGGEHDEHRGDPGDAIRR